MGSSQPTMSPSDVSSPLVVMATSSSITVTGGLCSPARGPQTTIFNVQAQQMTLRTVVTGPPVNGPQALHSSWNVLFGIISAAASRPVMYMFTSRDISGKITHTITLQYIVIPTPFQQEDSPLGGSTP
eukprot:Em0022g855a